MPKLRIGLTLLVLMAAGCATMDYGGTKGNILGSWKFKNPENGSQTLTFKRDGTFELDTDNNGTKNIWGNYRLSQNWLIINDVAGESSFDCGQEGAYLYQVSANDETLTFALMADQCPSRVQAMSAEWSRIHKRQPKPYQIKI